jgi:hypothetical protein
LAAIVQPSARVKTKGKPPPSPLLGQRVRIHHVDTDTRTDEWLAECCEVGPGFSQEAMVLAAHFAFWCHARGYNRPPFGFLGYHLAARGFHSSKATAKSIIVRHGLRLRAEPDTQP